MTDKEPIQFLNPVFQKNLWNATWGSLLPYEDGNTIPFNSWYSSIEFSDHPELKYKSKTFKHGDFYINSHLKFKIPKGLKTTRLKIIYDNELTRPITDNISEPGLILDAGRFNHIENLDENDNRLKSRKIRLLKNEIKEYTPVYIDLAKANQTKTTARDDGSLSLTPAIVSLFDRITQPNEISNNSWDAMDVRKVNNTTVKVFLTYNILEPNFHDLVFDIEFPRSLKDFQVGFYDNPRYFF